MTAQTFPQVRRHYSRCMICGIPISPFHVVCIQHSKTKAIREKERLRIETPSWPMKRKRQGRFRVRKLPSTPENIQAIAEVMARDPGAFLR